MENKNQPANPATIHQVKGNDIETVSFPGLSKREHFAGLAMQGLLSSRKDVIIDLNLELFADTAVKLADELLKKLKS